MQDLLNICAIRKTKTGDKMQISKAFLERAKFDFDKYAGYYTIRGFSFSVKEHEKGMKASIYASMARDLLYIAVLCCRVKKYYPAFHLINSASYAVKQAAALDNLDKCLKRCESILNGEAQK